MSGCDFSYLQSLLLGEDDLNNVYTVCWGDFDLDQYQLPHTEDVDFDDSFLENIFGFSNSDNKNTETIEYNEDKEIYMTETIEDNYISLECSEKMLFDDVCDEIELNVVETMSDHSKYDNLIEIVNENSRTSTEHDEELKKEKSRKEKNRTRASKTHETIAIKISTTYEKLPITFKWQKNIHRKITKAQKLAQIEKFVINVRQHGYVADK